MRELDLNAVTDRLLGEVELKPVFLLQDTTRVNIDNKGIKRHYSTIILPTVLG